MSFQCRGFQQLAEPPIGVPPYAGSRHVLDRFLDRQLRTGRAPMTFEDQILPAKKGNYKEKRCSPLLKRELGMYTLRTFSEAA